MILRVASGFSAGALLMLVIFLRDRLRFRLDRWWWWQGAWIAVTLGLFVVVHVEPRFVVASATLFWLVVYGIGLPSLNAATRTIVVAVACIATLVPAGIPIYVASRVAWEERNDRPGYLGIAAELERAGIGPGSAIASLDSPMESYWAQAGHLHFMGSIADAPGFLSLPENGQMAIESALAARGARAIVTEGPAPARWRHFDVSGKSCRTKVYAGSSDSGLRPVPFELRQ
jgi:hypothetical protein